MARPRTVGTSSASAPFGPVRLSVEQRQALDVWAARRKLPGASEALRDLLDLVLVLRDVEIALEAANGVGLEKILWTAEAELEAASKGRAELERLRAAIGVRFAPSTEAGTSPAAASSSTDTHKHGKQKEGNTRRAKRGGRGEGRRRQKSAPEDRHLEGRAVDDTGVEA